MKCLVAGGAGFVGSHIVETLMHGGHEVTVIDGLLGRTSGRQGNLAKVADRIRFHQTRIEETDALPALLAESDVVVDSMGWTCHRLALGDPAYDVELNILSHLALLTAIPAKSPLRLIFLGSRGQYGNPAVSEIDESTPAEPADVQGISKVAAESFVRLFARLKGFRAISLRFGNCFGPRMPLEGEDIGLIGLFIRDVLQGRPVELFGRGRSRPVIAVQDVADAVGRLIHAEWQPGFQPFDLAGWDMVLEELLGCLIAEAGTGSFTLREFPDEVRAIDAGNAAFLGRRLREWLGCEPARPLRERLAETIAYFKQNLP